MKVFKVIGVAMATLMLSGCMNANANLPIERIPDAYFSDNYEVGEDHAFELIEFDKLEEILTEGDGAILFSFPACPWCQEAMPLLNEAAIEMDELIYYYDPKEARESKDDVYEFIMSTLGEHLTEVDGEKKLLVPHVFFIKEGEIVADHFATFDGHDPRENELDEEEKEQLKEIYIEGFRRIKE